MRYFLLLLLFMYPSAEVNAKDKASCAWAARFLEKEARNYDPENINIPHYDIVRPMTGFTGKNIQHPRDCKAACRNKKAKILKDSPLYDPVVIEEYRKIKSFYFGCSYAFDKERQPVMETIESLRLSPSQLGNIEDFRPKELPKLKYASFRTQPVNISVGDFYNYTFSIENHGSADAENVAIEVYAKNQIVELVSPSVSVQKLENKFVFSIPQIGINQKTDIQLRVKALAATSRLGIGIAIKDSKLVHPEHQTLNTYKTIGRVEPAKAMNSSGEDPFILVTEKRWAYCRSKHVNKQNINKCAKEMAMKDKKCFVSQKKSDQLNCINRIYNN